MAQPGAKSRASQRPPVILLHGLGRTPASMWWLSPYLHWAGIPSHLLGFPSNRQGLVDNIETVRGRIADLRLAMPVNLVGHSMGGVISRHLCLEDNGLDVRRVVQLGAPNLGSALADRMGPFWAVRKACGPAIADLGVRSEILKPDPRIHAIAGTGGCHTRHSVLQSPHDGAVTVRSAWAGAAERYRVDAMHTLMPMSRDVARTVVLALTAPDRPRAT